MLNTLKTFQLFVRPDDHSKHIANTIRDLFSKSSYPLKESDNGDLVIAIGGDGTFLQAVDQSQFNRQKIYAGINTGTLGFLQDISPEEFYTFILFLNDQKEILTRKLFVPTITICTEASKHEFHAINELIVTGIHGRKITFSEYVNGDLFQRVSANSVCVACSNGDTAFSMNAGGSIDFSNHFQLVRTLSVPIMNAAYERFISNPIISPLFRFEFDPKDECEILVDGRLKQVDSKIISAEVSLYGAQYVHKLELGTYSKVNTIRQKILGYYD